MYCVQCGGKIPNIEKFCTYCGNKVNIAVDHAVQEGVQGSQSTKPVVEQKDYILYQGKKLLFVIYFFTLFISLSLTYISFIVEPETIRDHVYSYAFIVMIPVAIWMLVLIIRDISNPTTPLYSSIIRSLKVFTVNHL